MSHSFAFSSDISKKRSTLSKVAHLWQELGDSGQVVEAYSSLLDTYSAEEKEGEELAQSWLQLTNYLLQEKPASQSVWSMVN